MLKKNDLIKLRDSFIMATQLNINAALQEESLVKGDIQPED